MVLCIHGEPSLSRGSITFCRDSTRTCRLVCCINGISTYADIACAFTGRLETTFLFQVCRAANFRPILHDPDVRADLSDVIEVFERLQEEDHRGTRIAEAAQLNERASTIGFKKDCSILEAVELSIPAYEALVNRLNFEAQNELCLSRYRSYYIQPSAVQFFLGRKAVLTGDIFINGVTYRPKTKDGNLLFRDSTTSAVCAAHLEYIVLYDAPHQADQSNEQSVFLVVTRLVPLSEDDVSHDCYRKFGSSGGFLCYNQQSTSVEAIRPTQVVCHFARTVMSIKDIEHECVHVLPLNRVSNP